MGALLESGLVGNIGLKHLKVIKEDTITKWDKLGFLEGLKGHMRENVAQLYENQASYLINEASSTSDTGAFETVVFPIVRRVFSKLLANDIVSVQAMNLPNNCSIALARVSGSRVSSALAKSITVAFRSP